MKLRGSTLALLTALVPVAAVHAALLISLAAGDVPSCNPYLDGCISISRAARHGLANVVFKAVMIPYAVVLAAYWLSATRWLRRLDPRPGATARVMPTLGAISATFLVLYAVFLGTDGEIYELLRRYGVTVYFAFSYLAQLLLARRLHRIALPFPRWIVQLKLASCALVLTLGLANVVGSVVLEDNDRFENLIEWHAAALMMGFYLLTWRARR